MKIVERIVENNQWITLVLIGLLFLVFLLKIIDFKKLKGYFFILSNAAFIREETEERSSYLHPFYASLFLFSTSVVSILILKLSVNFIDGVMYSFLNFCFVLGGVLLYFTLKWLLEYGVSILFLIRNNVRFFLIGKSVYLFNISFFLYVGLIVEQYTVLGISFLIYYAAILFLLRALLLYTSNKKLIFSKLFYFILYICTLEIAPLLILFKLIL